MRSISHQLNSTEASDSVERERLEGEMRQLAQAFRHHQTEQRRARWLGPLLLGRLDPGLYEDWDVK